MSNVIVEPDKLISGGEFVQKKLTDSEDNYISVINCNTCSCTPLESFKTRLTSRYNKFSNHSSKFNTKINECATNLEIIDNQIGRYTNTLLASADTIDFSQMSASLTDLSEIDLSSEIDYTYDPSNYNISAEELYEKAAIIKNSNLPMNLKIVKVAKLFHEYTLTWHYSIDNLIYGKGYEATIEDPNKGLCCATAVSAILYLAGANTYEDMLVEGGKFNPHWQHNIERMAQRMNWTTISSSNLENLQPGDIILTSKQPDGSYGHVEIYIGNGYAYSWGCNADIQNEGPTIRSLEGYERDGAYAIRVEHQQSA